MYKRQVLTYDYVHPVEELLKFLEERSGSLHYEDSHDAVSYTHLRKFSQFFSVHDRRIYWFVSYEIYSHAFSDLTGLDVYKRQVSCIRRIPLRR